MEIKTRHNLTPEIPPHKVCHHCTRRNDTCHADCAEYAAEVMLDIIGRREVASNRQLENDMFNMRRLHQRKDWT